MENKEVRHVFFLFSVFLGREGGSLIVLKSKSKNGFSALIPISSFCLPQIIGLSHLVICGAYTATIPPGSWLSMYRSLAGVYYSEGRCQGEEKVVVEVAGRFWRLWRQVQVKLGAGTAGISVSSLSWKLQNYFLTFIIWQINIISTNLTPIEPHQPLEWDGNYEFSIIKLDKRKQQTKTQWQKHFYTKLRGVRMSYIYYLLIRFRRRIKRLFWSFLNSKDQVRNWKAIPSKE